MTIYEIDKRLQEAFDRAVDVETGEINEEAYAEFEQLEMARKDKIENVAMWIKDLDAFGESLAKEIDTLSRRLVANEKKIDRLKSYLTEVCGGEKFETPRVKISFRTSQSVDITDETKIPDDMFVEQPAVKKVSKKLIMEKLKAGENVEGARLLEKQNIQVK